MFKFARGGERLSAIKREATLMRVLRDTLGERDDFVRVLDWNFETEPCFLECEYGGESLPEWAGAHGEFAGWNQAQRLDFFLQVAVAVDAAHGVGVLHKDIKPANILVRPRRDGGWQACLTDFGSSRLLQPGRLAELGITGLGLTVTRPDAGSSGGTPLYLAPELVAGQPPTVRSDLYALGVLLYQLLVGDLRRPMAPGWERDIDDPLLVEDISRATDGDPARRLGSVAGPLNGWPRCHGGARRRGSARTPRAVLSRRNGRWIARAAIVDRGHRHAQHRPVASSLLWPQRTPARSRGDAGARRGGGGLPERRPARRARQRQRIRTRPHYARGAELLPARWPNAPTTWPPAACMPRWARLAHARRPQRSGTARPNATTRAFGPPTR